MFLDGEAAVHTGPPDDEEQEVPLEAPDGCVVYSAASLYEAQLILHRLEEAGVEASLFNQHLVGALGELPFQECLPKIWLPDCTQWEQARGVIAAYEARQQARADETRKCHACGETGPANFELCWSCRAPLDGERDA